MLLCGRMLGKMKTLDDTFNLCMNLFSEYSAKTLSPVLSPDFCRQLTKLGLGTLESAGSGSPPYLQARTLPQTSMESRKAPPKKDSSLLLGSLLGSLPHKVCLMFPVIFYVPKEDQLHIASSPGCTQRFRNTLLL